MQRQDLKEGLGFTVALVQHDGPGRVQLGNGSGVEVSDEDVEQVREMPDAVGAGGKVVVGGYGEEVLDMRAQLLQQLLGLGFRYRGDRRASPTYLQDMPVALLGGEEGGV